MAWIEQIVRIVEIIGVGIIVTGALGALCVFAIGVLRDRRIADRAGTFRSNLGRAILLGLEFLVAADIINTVAVEVSLDSLAVLGGIVLIRTFLSLSLEVEIEGRWPWQRAQPAEAQPAPRN